MKDSWKLYYFLPVMCSGECDTRSRFTEYAVGKISVLEVQKEVLCWTEPVDIYLLRSNQWQFYTLYLLAPLHISSPLNTMTLILLSCITLWTSLFVELTVSFWAWCHCRVVSQEGSSYLALPFPYHHVAPASHPPTHFSLLASVRRFEGNHKYLVTSFDKYSFRTYYVSGILLVTRCSIEPDTHSPHPQGAWRPLESNISLYEVRASSCQALGSLCTLSHWNLLEAAIPTVLILQGRRLRIAQGHTPRNGGAGTWVQVCLVSHA